MPISSNKDIVLDMYRRMIGARDISLLDTFISDHYIQHSPMLRDGKEGLREALTALKQLPVSGGQGSPVICAVAEGDYVALLLDITLMGKTLKVVDLFRLEQGLIVEHWDAMEDKGTSAIASDGKELTGLIVHRILRDSAWTVIQSSGYIGGVQYVCYDVQKSENIEIQQFTRVVQAIPAVMPHGNGMT